MLTEKECKNATCPADRKRARFTDASGLYLEVSPTGSKRWFLKIYGDGKESRLALGSYPSVSLSAARLARDRVKVGKAEGVDPIEARRQAKKKTETVEPTSTFKAIANEWFGKQRKMWSETHADRCYRQLERDLFPLLGGIGIEEIKAPKLLEAIRFIEKRGAYETASRALMLCGQVWRYAVASGIIERDITVDLKGALTPYRGKHFAAIVDPEEFGKLLIAIDNYHGGVVVKSALRLAPLVFQRPGELRGARWEEVNFDESMWTIPAQRMKRGVHGKEYGDPHIVPLSKQALEIFKFLYAYTGNGEFCFPSPKSKERPISENSVRTALLALGYSSDRHTWHGFRASARTMLDEQLEVDILVIESQLAHAVKDANGRAYNRTKYIKQRSAMMQSWADYLDTLKSKE